MSEMVLWMDSQYSRQFGEGVNPLLNPLYNVSELYETQYSIVSNVFEIVAKKSEDGKVTIYFRLYALLREGSDKPYLSIDHYNELVPKLLPFFGEERWSPLSHMQLYYYKTKTELIVTPDGYTFGERFSPCHQLVMATLVCNQELEFGVRLPDSVWMYIFTFLSQALFRCGDGIENWSFESEDYADKSNNDFN